MARIDLKQCTVVMEDGTTPTANSLALKIGEGTIKYRVKRNFVYVKDRGLLSTVRKGDQDPVEVSFDLIYEDITIPASQNPLVSPEDFLKKVGNASGYVTAGADPCQPYAVTLVFTQDQNCSPTKTEVITFTEFRYTKISADVKSGKLSVTGSCNIIDPAIARV